MALSLQCMGLIAVQREHLAGACTAYREGRAITRTLIEESPDVGVPREDLAFFEQALKDAGCSPP